MKLLKCYIENFGKLSQFSYNFDKNYNEIFKDNGWGKTTFATFIKAMFYGMTFTTRKQLDENERKKYTPWQGGRYGGYIEFEVDGNKFKVERYFGKKSKDDDFRLIDLKTGKVSNQYTSNLGEELFGLDVESYERSTFIPQKIISNDISGEIKNKLVNYIEGTTGENNFENAIKILKESKSELKKPSGKINKLKESIESKKQEISELEDNSKAINLAQNKLTELNEKLEYKKNEVEEINKNIKLLAEQAEIRQKQKNINRLTSELNNCIESLNNSKKVLNNNDITNQEIEKYEEIINKYNSAINQRNFYENDSKIKSNFEKFINIYGYNPETIDVDNYISKLSDAKELEAKISYDEKMMNERLELKLNNNKRYSSLLLTSIIISLVVLFGGIGLLFIQKIVAIICILLGMLGFLVTIYMYFHHQKKLKTEKFDSSDSYNQGLYEKYNTILCEIKSFVCKYQKMQDIDQKENYAKYLYEIKSDIEHYNNIKEEYDQYNLNLSNCEKEILNLKNELDLYFSKFEINSFIIDYSKKLGYLREVLNSINNYKIQINNINQHIEEIQSEINPNIILFDSVYDIDYFQRKHDMVQSEIEEYTNSIGKCENDIETYKENLENIVILKGELEELKQELINLEEKLNVIEKTEQFLITSNDAMCSKYLDAMKNSVNKYLKEAIGDDFKGVEMDVELNISVEEFGKTWEIDYLSRGYQDVINLCVRLALVDVLFENEKPFIILDDSLANLDQNKIKNALRVIKRVSNEYQVINLVCHESRLLKNLND